MINIRLNLKYFLLLIDIRCSIQKVCCLIVYCSAGEMKLNSVISYAKKRVFRAKFVKIFPGGPAPLAPRQGLRPCTPLGAAPPDPCRSSLSGATRRFGRTQNATGSLRSPVRYTTSQNVLPPGSQRMLWTYNHSCSGVAQIFSMIVRLI